MEGVETIHVNIEEQRWNAFKWCCERSTSFTWRSRTQIVKTTLRKNFIEIHLCTLLCRFYFISCIFKVYS